MIELVIQLVENPPLLEALVLRDQLPVSLPESAAETGAPRHAPLSLVVTIVGCGIVNGWLAIRACDVAAPEVAVKAAWLHLDPLKHRVEPVRLLTHLVPQLLELRVSCKLHLMPNALLPEEPRPVVIPAVGLGGPPDRVVDWESKLPLLGLLDGRLREVHLRNRPAQRLLVTAPTQRQILHDDVAPPLAIIPPPQNLGNPNSPGLVHGLQPQRLPSEHLLSTLPARLDEVLLPITTLVLVVLRPGGAPHAG
mmetsp:Transcript_18828/g.46237  ORF Transcript_18828/g.46237 Transcript_18828/m.46237 type:complete len:251 (+) Transcript_18828:206-958(+)